MRDSMLARVLLVLSLAFAAAVSGTIPAPLVVVGRIDTPIHPASANYLAKVLAEAEKDGAALVVLTLSTPGGLLASPHASSRPAHFSGFRLRLGNKMLSRKR